MFIPVALRMSKHIQGKSLEPDTSDIHRNMPPRNKYRKIVRGLNKTADCMCKCMEIEAAFSMLLLAAWREEANTQTRE
jgi:hypothetical protein